MTRSGFVIANLFRKRTRTILTLLSVIMAFLLFGLLQSVNTIFNAGADFVGATRLMVQARVSFTSPLPLSMVPKLEAIPGVARVAYQQWFGGVWQQNTPLIMFCIDPQRYRDAMGRKTAPLIVEAESAYRDLDATSANGVQYVRDNLCFPLAAGSFEEGMGA